MARSAAALKVVAVEKPTFGELVNRLVEIKEEKSEMAAREKELNAERDSIEASLRDEMVQQGTTEVTVNGKRVSFKTKLSPKITDGAALWKFVKKHDRYDLYYSRLKLAEYEELYHLNKDKPLPGTEVIETPEISIRSVSQAS